MTLIVLLVVIVFIALIFIGSFNGLVSKRVACDNAWSQIDVQLKRRYDLIPNLVETVKGYAAHEKGTLEAVIQARNSAISASSSGNVQQVAQAEGALSGALRQVFALSESYPDLKANQNFSQLQEELVSTENRVGFARQHYNDSVGTYQTALGQLPGSIVAGFGNFPAKQFFELDAGEKAAAAVAPKVSF